MFKGLGNIASLVKQAQTMGPKMQEAMEALKNRTVTGTSGGGMVTVHADGIGNILRIEIDPLLEQKNDMEMIKGLSSRGNQPGDRQTKTTAHGSHAGGHRGFAAAWKYGRHAEELHGAPGRKRLDRANRN